MGARWLMWPCLAVMVLGLRFATTQAAEEGKADVVLRNGKIYRQGALD
jgi:hypothetical protein